MSFGNLESAKKKLDELFLNDNGFAKAEPNDFPLYMEYFREKLVMFQNENAVLKKRLQKLEIERKARAKGQAASSRRESRSPAPILKNSGRGRGGKNSGASSTRKVSYADDVSKSSNRSKKTDSETGSKNPKSTGSGNNGQQSTTRIKLWKHLPKELKQKLRKEELQAYKKLPQKEWKAMLPEARAKVAKERKARIQDFQRKMTEIAVKVASEKLEERVRKEESKKEDVAMKDSKAGAVGTGGNQQMVIEKPPIGPKQGGTGTIVLSPTPKNKPGK
jgi:hypothetical protein